MIIRFGKTQTTIRMTVVSVFVLTTALTAALAIGLQYHFGRTNASRAAADLFAVASSGMAAEYRQAGEVTANTMDLLSNIPGILETAGNQEKMELLTQVLLAIPFCHGVYVAGDDGSLFEVVNLDANEQTRRDLNALPTDRWLALDVAAGEGRRVRSLQFLDKNLVARCELAQETDFDPRQEAWYGGALDSEGVWKSSPHLLADLGVPGRTLSRRIGGTDAVVGLRMTLNRISEILLKNKFHERAEVFLYDREGALFATSEAHGTDGRELPVPRFTLSAREKEQIASLPPLKVSNELNWPPFDYAQAGKPMGYSVDMMRMIAAMTGLEIEFVNGYSWPELVDRFRSGDIDLLHSVILTPENRSLGLPGVGCISLPYGLATSESQAPLSSLEQLDGKSLAIPAGWSIIPVIRGRYPGITIVEVDNTLAALESALFGEVDAALDNEIIMRYVARHYFLEGVRYHSDLDFGDGGVPDALHIMVPLDRPGLRVLLDRAIASLDGAPREYLHRKWLAFDSPREPAPSSAVPSETLIRIAGTPGLQGRIVETSLNGVPQVAYAVPLGAGEQESDPLFIGILMPQGTIQEPLLSKVRLSILITAGFLALLLPVSWFFANPIVRPIRMLARENEKVRLRRYDQVERIDSQVKELDELSESLVNMVASIQAHERAQKKLMDSFIELIAQAIDDKSPYTGGHCERVPELALMLAESANRSEEGAFQDFRLETEDQWREFRIAALLHDCGKVTTPEHIVDKGSKLETIYNRIHEVRMRFEVLWRDAMIDYLEAKAEKPEIGRRLSRELEARRKQLREDFAFVADCNVGGEFLSSQKQERLRDIALTTWQRNFDDRLGLSPVEELRLPPEGNELPVTEPLLGDRPEHIISRQRATDFAAELGINMEIPEHAGNLGEIYNLSVSRGTLTFEDRFRIQEHMISTIKMLESLPFPDELKNVPRYASTHHETMSGNGYPRGLTGEQLSIPERLLAVADVFEALTASDRPYKKAKAVSEALDILHKMVLAGHLDGDCFELFLREKVYLTYADRFLAPDQIDAVDVARYMQPVG